MDKQSENVFDDKKIDENYDFGLKKQETKKTEEPEQVKEIKEHVVEKPKKSNRLGTFILIVIVLILITTVAILIIKRPKIDMKLVNETQDKYLESQKELEELRNKYDSLNKDMTALSETNDYNLNKLAEYQKKIDEIETRKEHLKQAQEIEESEKHKKTYQQTKQEKFDIVNAVGEKRKAENEEFNAEMRVSTSSDKKNDEVKTEDNLDNINIDDSLIN